LSFEGDGEVDAHFAGLTLVSGHGALLAKLSGFSCG
jgi:hypothetical protein